MEYRKLGNMLVSPIGLGGWAIGGEFWEGDQPLGWGKVDDKESIRAIHYALDNGVNFIDTANIYGAGHSEVVIGQAVKDKRANVILSSKFGFDADEKTKQILGSFSNPHEIQAMCEASLRRLDTDYLDVYYFHIGDHPIEQIDEIRETLEDLVNQGKILSYGWSTDCEQRAASLIGRPGFTSVQFENNVLNPNQSLMTLCERHSLAGVNRSPLAMGLLSEKHLANMTLSDTDIRKLSPEWLSYFENGKPSPRFVSKIEAIRDILTSDGRSLVQGSLAWLWAQSPNNIPIPGFRTEQQVQQLIQGIEKGPLKPIQLEQIQNIMANHVIEPSLS